MKRKARLARGLSGLLALVLVGRLSVLVGYGQWTGAFSVRWQPIANWSIMAFGDRLMGLCDVLSPSNEPIADIYCLGPVQVFVPHHHK